MTSRSAAVCVHACNEANLLVLRNCRDAGATYAVMPCCLPEGIYSSISLHLLAYTRDWDNAAFAQDMAAKTHTIPLLP